MLDVAEGTYSLSFHWIIFNPEHCGSQPRWEKQHYASEHLTQPELHLFRAGAENVDQLFSFELRRLLPASSRQPTGSDLAVEAAAAGLRWWCRCLVGEGRRRVESSNVCQRMGCRHVSHWRCALGWPPGVRVCVCVWKISARNHITQC